MTQVKVTLPGQLAVALQGRLEQRRLALPGSVRLGAAAYLAALLRQDLGAVREAQRQDVDRLVRQYADAWMAFAARTFKKLRGAIAIEDLQAWAFEESRKACARYDVTTGNSPASYIKGWLKMALRGYLRERFTEHEGLVFIDGDGDDGGISKWERIGAEDVGLETSPDAGRLRAALADFARARVRVDRQVLRLLADGAGEDDIAEQLGIDAEAVAAVRQDLAAYLEAAGLAPRPDEEVLVSEAAAGLGLETKVVYKAMGRGQLAGRRRGGRWWLRVSDVRAWARARGYQIIHVDS